MNADEVLVFPAGVRTGHPFSAPIDAVTWLCNAAAGAFGPMPSAVYGLEAWNVPVEKILRPLYPSDTPYPIPDWEPGARYVSFPQQWEKGPPLPPLMVTDLPPVDRFAQWPPDPAEGGVWAEFDIELLVRWRSAIGAEVLVRGVFDALEKSERPEGAKVLGAYEDLVDSTGQALVTYMNRWISTAWTDALNGPLPVVPDPTPGHAYTTTYTQTAVGTVRIGVSPPKK